MAHLKNEEEIEGDVEAGKKLTGRKLLLLSGHS